MFEIGQVVFSKAGRDKGCAFVVISCEDIYAYLADGELRRIEQPKKKKAKHIQKTNTVSEELREKIISNKISNSDIAKYLKERV